MWRARLAIGQIGRNSAIFAGNKIRISDHFIGASLNAVFGGLTIDLRDAVIDSDVEISTATVFGGIDIYLPQEVQVRVNNIPILESKRLYTSEPNGLLYILTQLRCLRVLILNEYISKDNKICSHVICYYPNSYNPDRNSWSGFQALRLFLMTGKKMV